MVLLDVFFDAGSRYRSVIAYSPPVGAPDRYEFEFLGLSELVLPPVPGTQHLFPRVDQLAVAFSLVAERSASAHSARSSARSPVAASGATIERGRRALRPDTVKSGGSHATSLQPPPGLGILAPLVLMASVLVLLSIVALEAAGQCYLGGHLYNRDREIAQGGVIEGECPPSWHGEPFGNWGVHSRFGPRRNGNQFAGWNQDEHPGQWHWNSCTTHEDYDPPSADHYNRPLNDPRWWQHTERGEERVNSAWFDRSGETCRARWDGRVYTFDNLEMRVYEMDWDGDDHVGTLKYGDVQVRLHCSGTWDCEGDSGWEWEDSVDPSNSKISAQGYVFVSTDEK